VGGWGGGGGRGLDLLTSTFPFCSYTFVYDSIVAGHLIVEVCDELRHHEAEDDGVVALHVRVGDPCIGQTFT
jgi:hypothetical protein